MGLIAIGDIHGCLQTLNRLLEVLSPSQDDHLVFVGDYVDRGPDSRGVIERLIALREEVPCTFLRGNHELFMLEYLRGESGDLWWINGGLTTVNSYRFDSGHVDIPASHVEFLQETLPYLDTPGFFFVHAGLKPNLTVAENIRRHGEDVFLWERSHLEARNLAWEKPVVVGHTPQPEPINTPKLIGIDTGCVYFTRPELGNLTAVRLPEREFVTVPYQG